MTFFPATFLICELSFQLSTFDASGVKTRCVSMLMYDFHSGLFDCFRFHPIFHDNQPLVLCYHFSQRVFNIIDVVVHRVFFSKGKIEKSTPFRQS